MPLPNTSISASNNVSSWIGAIVVTPNGHVEGEINEVVIDSVTGKVRYFVVAIDDATGDRATIFALPFGDCQFDETSNTCVAKAMYPLRI